MVDVVDVGDVREGVSDPGPAAESVERGAGEPSASPRVMVCEASAADDPDRMPPKARGDFILLPVTLLTPLPPVLPPPTNFGCTIFGAGLSDRRFNRNENFQSKIESTDFYLGGKGGKSILRSATRPMDAGRVGAVDATEVLS